MVVSKQSLIISHVVIKLEKVQRTLELEKVCHQSKSCDDIVTHPKWPISKCHVVSSHMSAEPQR